MKFRDPKTGEVFEDFTAALFNFCSAKCRECAVSCWNNEDKIRCDLYFSKHPVEAALLMGYEVIEDEKEDKPMKQVKKLKDLKPGAAKQISEQDILEALHCHGSPHHECELCPYQQYDGCSAKLARDALALLEEMERGKSD